MLDEIILFIISLFSFFMACLSTNFMQNKPKIIIPRQFISSLNFYICKCLSETSMQVSLRHLKVNVSKIYSSIISYVKVSSNSSLALLPDIVISFQLHCKSVYLHRTVIGIKTYSTTIAS